MERNGLLIDMTAGVANLAEGRRKLYKEGTEVEGLQLYLNGYRQIVKLFDEAIATDDPELMLLAEFFYTAKELAESTSKEPKAQKSGKNAVMQFEEALKAVHVVVNPERYKAVNEVISTRKTYRHKGMPKDAFHVGCLADCARINNGLSRSGLSDEDLKMGIVRLKMMNAAIDSYIEFQKKAL